MSQTIEIDDEVWERLKSEAEPLVDSPNSVLRRVLGLESAEDRIGPTVRASGANRGVRQHSSGRPRSAGRAPVGSLLPESEYEIPLLSVLARRGGSAPSRDVVAAVGEMMQDRLTELDRQALPNGGERWQSRVQFTRLRLKERGLIESGSPRGLWELSQAGAAYLGAQDGQA